MVTKKAVRARQAVPEHELAVARERTCSGRTSGARLAEIEAALEPDILDGPADGVGDRA